MSGHYKDPCYYHNKSDRMIKRYLQKNGNQFYLITGEVQGHKSIHLIMHILKDPKLAPYNSDNDEPGN